MTHSRSHYVHWIDLYDAAGNQVDPTDPEAPPYSPVHTCGRCHDYDAMAHGYHFNATRQGTDSGRPGEPWVWTDTRTGTQIPLSYRGWPGTYDPGDLGINSRDFLLQFGRHLPGGGPGESPRGAPEGGLEVSARDQEGDGPAESPTPDADSPAVTQPAATDNSRWQLTGALPIDCMLCHSRDAGYSREVWWDQITKQNFAWAPAAALGLASIEGDVSKLPEDFDPATEREPGEEDQPRRTGPRLPKTTYHPLRMNAENKIFFDVVLKPSNEACYYCHTTRVVGEGQTPAWTHDEDIHLRAGMSCVDCHRNDVEHHTVRGYEGEVHPTGWNVVSLSCRGCHLDDPDVVEQLTGGRLGAPKPLHRGLPPIHLELLSCTACHSGPPPGNDALRSPDRHGSRPGASNAPPGSGYRPGHGCPRHAARR